jgi:hypothetical protein
MYVCRSVCLYLQIVILAAKTSNDRLLHMGFICMQHEDKSRPILNFGYIGLYTNRLYLIETQVLLIASVRST